MLELALLAVIPCIKVILDLFREFFSRKPSKRVDLTKATKVMILNNPKFTPSRDVVASNPSCSISFTCLEISNPRRRGQQPQRELVAKARAKLSAKLGFDLTKHYIIAIVGASAVGKSSLINAVRFMRDDAPGAAIVGERETTKTVRSFPYPHDPHLLLCDLPGAGTLKVSADKYFKEQMLYAFDAILLLTGGRFLEMDIKIAKLAKTYRIKFAFVRTKCDRSVIKKAQKGKTMLQASKDLRKEVTKNMKDQLGRSLWKSRQPPKLFFVSSSAFTSPEGYIYRKDNSLVQKGMDEWKIIEFMFALAGRCEPIGTVAREHILMAKARAKLGIDMINNYNFAIVGASGVGKSSLINAMRFMRDDARGAAKAGMTTTVRSFPYQEYPHVLLWDFPGAGTRKVSADKYFEEQMLYAFDAIFLLTADRFLRVNINIAKMANKYGKMCAFVRTKCDESVKSKARRGRGMTMLQASKDLRKEVVKDIKDRLGLNLWKSLQPKVFFVSSRAFLSPDEYRYREDKSLVKKNGMDEGDIVEFMVTSARTRL